MIFFCEGGTDLIIDQNRISDLIDKMLVQVGKSGRVLILPPDMTRYYSYAGEITRLLYEKLKGNSYIEIMPAIGSHLPLSEEELDLMFGGIPHRLFRRH